MIRNKVNPSTESIGPEESAGGHVTITPSACTGADLELLHKRLKAYMGSEQTAESGFSARRHHLEALRPVRQALEYGHNQPIRNSAGELLAEDLRQAQQHLDEVAGAFTSDDLLGRILSSFYIDK